MEKKKSEEEERGIHPKWDSAKDGFDFVCKMSRGRRGA